MITDQIKPIAFFLPQFHPTRVNDVNWGPGFSDWLNVVRARPLFEGHYQPRLPGMLGFYDLRCGDTLEEQAQLARAYGVHGFCIYYYRFGNRRVLDLPLNLYLSRPVPDFPFLLCWANENWTRSWDGRNDSLLLEQSYDEATLNGLVADLVGMMRDRRYIRVNGRPIFLIYQIEVIPDYKEWIAKLREALRAQLGEDIYIGCVYSHGFASVMLNVVDFVVQFPPHRIPRVESRKLLSADEVNPYDLGRKDYFEAYADVVEASLAGLEQIGPLLPGVTPDWDNSPRRPTNAHILIGSTPARFEDWVSLAGRVALQKYSEGLVRSPLLFVNAWNEWGEGAVLEPTAEGTNAYLEALSAGIDRAMTTTTTLVADSTGR